MREGRVRVHGANISYFTGKLEAYLRYKEIPLPTGASNSIDASKEAIEGMSDGDGGASQQQTDNN